MPNPSKQVETPSAPRKDPGPEKIIVVVILVVAVIAVLGLVLIAGAG